jgi:hypothetical protein
MEPISLGAICFLIGSLITGGTLWGIEASHNRKNGETAKVIEAIGNLETKYERSQAQAVVNLTQPDLLKVPCSSEYVNGTYNEKGEQVISGRGDGLCRELFCRMNRQGGGQNSGGGAGATAQDCSSISDANLSKLVIETCLPFWDEQSATDQNSKFQQCRNIFGEKK